VRQGSPIVFRNMDGDPHTVTSVPGDSATFDVTIPPGGTTTISITAPGVHRYYCRLHARFDTATGEVAALPSADHPDEPMMGVLVMQPPG
jgi:plastocyanin